MDQPRKPCLDERAIFGAIEATLRRRWPQNDERTISGIFRAAAERQIRAANALYRHAAERDRRLGLPAERPRRRSDV